MATRAFSILIIGFWLVMTGLLARRIWFPEETRFAEISPSAVLELFASRSEPSRLEIYNNRDVIGSLRITPPSRPAGSDRPVRVNLDGELKLGGALLPTPVGLQIRGRFMIGPAGELFETDLRIRIPGPGPREARTPPVAEMRLTQENETAKPRITLFRSGAMLFDSAAGDTSSAAGGEDALFTTLLPLAGLSPEKLREMLPANSGGAAAEPRFTARQGTFSFASHPPFSGYLISSSSSKGDPAGGSDHSFRMYLDQSGEILRVETPVGYVLSQEDLALDGTRKPETPP